MPRSAAPPRYTKRSPFVDSGIEAAPPKLSPESLRKFFLREVERINADRLRAHCNLPPTDDFYWHV